MDFYLGREVNLEGLVAAIGISAAAIGYILDRILAFAERRKIQRAQGDVRVILEILEENFVEGLTEQEILQRFKQDNFVMLGEKLRATDPKKFTENDLERRLRDLQYDHFVDRTVSGRYVLRTAFERHTDREKEMDKRRAQYIRGKVDPQAVLTILTSNFGRIENWQRDSIVRALPQIGTTEALDELTNQMRSDDPVIATAAALEISRYLSLADE